MSDDEDHRDQARVRAWETRRAKYGERGHRGYPPRRRPDRLLLHDVPLARLAAVIHDEGVMTESQIARIIERDIVATRRLIDLGREHLSGQPPEGEWAANILLRLGLK